MQLLVQARVARPYFERNGPSDVAGKTPATAPEGLPTINPESGAKFFTAADSRPVILFDGSCNLCNAGVQFMLDWDTAGKYRLAALQSDAGKALLMRSGRQPGVYQRFERIATDQCASITSLSLSP